MVATGELAKQLILAIVELVVAKGADHVAALLGEGLGAAGSFICQLNGRQNGLASRLSRLIAGSSRSRAELGGEAPTWSPS